MPCTLTREEVMTMRVPSPKGLRNGQIAREIGLTERTVRYHVGRGKSGVVDGRASKPSKADEFARAVETWRAAHAGALRPVNIKELYEHLEAEYGYQGSYKSGGCPSRCEI